MSYFFVKPQRNISYKGRQHMYYFLSIIAGILISVMVMLNGKLSEHYGIYFATAIIHFVGFMFSLVLAAVKREPLLPHKKIPLHYYLGGTIGVLTVLFNNMSYGKISVSAILALSLLGQCITSLVFDQYGFYGMPKRKFRKNKFLGIAIVLLGIIVMVSFYKLSAWVPIILSLLTGFTVVYSRTVNAGLAEKTSVLRSTLYCYGTGFLASLVLLLAIGSNRPVLSNFTVSANALIYFGGVMGVAIITILNASVAKISSFYMTLLLFAGQVFAGIAVDMFLTQSFSLSNLLGGVFVVLGLSVNVWMDRRESLKDAAADNTTE